MHSPTSRRFGWDGCRARAVGTGNLLARNLDLPLEIEPALDVAFGSGRRHLDVLEAYDGDYAGEAKAMMVGVLARAITVCVPPS